MGLYDVVMVPCPKCGTKHEAQSKGGECLMQWYELDSAPADVLMDVNRHAPFTCNNCGNEFSVTESDYDLYRRASILLDGVITWEDLSEQARDSLSEVKRLIGRMRYG